MKEYVYIRKTTTYAGRRYEVRGKTEEEAVEKLNQLKANLRQGNRLSGGSITVNQWYQKWVTVYKASVGLTEKSLSLYDEKYNKYLRPTIGRMLLEDIRDFHLQELLNTQAGMSYSHVTKLRMVMQEMFRQAFRSRLIPFDPSEGLLLPENVRHSRRSITEEERSHILAVAQDHFAGLWVLTLLYTGLRPGESAALSWGDVDFTSNELHVSKALESGSNALKPPKTPAGIREIPLHRTLREALWEARGEPNEPVFLNSWGRRHNHSSLYRMWAAFLEDLDLHMGAVRENGVIVQHRVAPDLTPYCLRHTFCTDLQRAGVPLNVAKELMGHADVSVTANVYTHRNTEVLHTNIARLETVSL